MSGPLSPFTPTREAMKELKEEIGTIPARTHLTRLNMALACQRAATVDELRPIILALISLARFD